MEPTAESEFVHTTAPPIFDDLKAILTPFAARLVVQSDAPRSYTLTTAHLGKNKQPLYFAAVRINKNYVSFHLVPVYEYPVLLQTISPELRARMQGKACFNFKKRDAALFEALAALVQKCFTHYEDNHLLQ